MQIKSFFQGAYILVKEVNTEKGSNITQGNNHLVSPYNVPKTVLSTLHKFAFFYIIFSSILPFLPKFKIS